MSQKRDVKRASVYRKWIWANAWSELFGLGGTMLIGFLVFSRFDNGQPLVVIGGVLFAVLAGAALEGGLVGYAQAHVLRQVVREFHVSSWIWATVIGAGTAWLFGMIPSTVFALTNPTPAEQPQELGRWAALGAAAVLGLFLGPVLSFPQALVLRAAGWRAWSWIAANAIAWAFGMVVMFEGMSVVPQSSNLVLITITVGTICFATGVVVGVIHGAWLVRLLRMANADPQTVESIDVV